MAKGLFLGIAGIDLRYDVDVFPKENTKTKTADYVLTLGGPALNAALAFRGLGGEATLVSRFGHSVFARYIQESLKQKGIECIDLDPELEQPYVSSIILRREAATRTIYSAQPAMGALTLPELPPLDFVLTDGNLTGVYSSIETYVSHHHVPLVIDAGSWKSSVETLLCAATTVISSETFRSPEGEDVFALSSRLGFPEAAMTRGEKSILLPKGEIEVRPVKGDTTGAGDYFHGAYCFYRYHEGLNFEESLAQASERCREFIASTSR